jgi:hypothetical protein
MGPGRWCCLSPAPVPFALAFPQRLAAPLDCCRPLLIGYRAQDGKAGLRSNPGWTSEIAEVVTPANLYSSCRGVCGRPLSFVGQCCCCQLPRSPSTVEGGGGNCWPGLAAAWVANAIGEERIGRGRRRVAVEDERVDVSGRGRLLI